MVAVRGWPRDRDRERERERERETTTLTARARTNPKRHAQIYNLLEIALSTVVGKAPGGIRFPT